MIIELNRDLQVSPHFKDTASVKRATQLHSELHYVAWKKDKAYSDKLCSSDICAGGQPTNKIFFTKGFVGMLSQAYSNHLPVAVAPHDFWFVANTELAALITKQPEAFREFFTASEGKEAIITLTSDVAKLDFKQLKPEFNKRFPYPGMADLLVPIMTTVDSRIYTALIASVADAVKHYYEYFTMACGIPAIRVDGVEADYRLLQANADDLSRVFKDIPDAREYYERIAGLLERIADTFAFESVERNVEFWQDIYTHKNVGSGSDKDIDGWIRGFFTARPNRLDAFNTSIACVPYRNLETSREFLAMFGAFVAADDEGFYKTNYHEVVFEKGAQ